jgi:hypothetical protein
LNLQPNSQENHEGEIKLENQQTSKRNKKIDNSASNLEPIFKDQFLTGPLMAHLIKVAEQVINKEERAF